MSEQLPLFSSRSPSLPDEQSAGPAAPGSGASSGVKRRRRLQPWEIERAKLKRWQRERRLADRGRLREPDPAAVARAAAALAHLSTVGRCEREAVRCGCLPAGRFPGRDWFGVPL